jgi:hypothetical protein
MTTDRAVSVPPSEPRPLIYRRFVGQAQNWALIVVRPGACDAARNDSQYLAANRGAAGPDEEPVDREEPP